MTTMRDGRSAYRFSELVLAMVKSVPFDQQRTETPVALAAK